MDKYPQDDGAGKGDGRGRLDGSDTGYGCSSDQFYGGPAKGWIGGGRGWGEAAGNNSQGHSPGFLLHMEDRDGLSGFGFGVADGVSRDMWTEADKERENIMLEEAREIEEEEYEYVMTPYGKYLDILPKYQKVRYEEVRKEYLPTWKGTEEELHHAIMDDLGVEFFQDLRIVAFNALRGLWGDEIVQEQFSEYVGQEMLDMVDFYKKRIDQLSPKEA